MTSSAFQDPRFHQAEVSSELDIRQPYWARAGCGSKCCDQVYGEFGCVGKKLLFASARVWYGLEQAVAFESVYPSLCPFFRMLVVLEVTLEPSYIGPPGTVIFH